MSARPARCDPTVRDHAIRARCRVGALAVRYSLFGWPLHYVRPPSLSTRAARVALAGAPPRAPAPSGVSSFAMAASFLLILAATSALVYALQFCAVMSAISNSWPSLHPRRGTEPRPNDDYDSPNDALAAAARLDGRGHWEAPIDLYRHAAKRWLEHAEYVQRCVDPIAEKQSLAQS